MILSTPFTVRHTTIMSSLLGAVNRLYKSELL